MHPGGLFECVVTSRISADTGLLPLRLITYLRPLYGAFLPSLNSRNLADLAPGPLFGRQATADTTKLHIVPIYQGLPNRINAHQSGAQIGYSFRGQSVPGDRVSPGEGATGRYGVKGLFRRVLVTTR